MERSSISSISLFLKRIFKPAEKVICYHCGEQSTPSRTLYITFEGETRAVCCSGCAAILKTVEEPNGFFSSNFLPVNLHAHLLLPYRSKIFIYSVLIMTFFLISRAS